MSLLLLFHPRVSGASVATGDAFSVGTGVFTASGSSVSVGDAFSAGVGDLQAAGASSAVADFFTAGIGDLLANGGSLNAADFFMDGVGNVLLEGDGGLVIVPPVYVPPAQLGEGGASGRTWIERNKRKRREIEIEEDDLMILGNLIAQQLSRDYAQRISR